MKENKGSVLLAKSAHYYCDIGRLESNIAFYLCPLCSLEVWSLSKLVFEDGFLYRQLPFQADMVRLANQRKLEDLLKHILLISEYQIEAGLLCSPKSCVVL